MKQQTITISVRCPIHLHEKLTLEAEEQRRSLSGQIVKILDEHIQRKETEK